MSLSWRTVFYAHRVRRLCPSTTSLTGGAHVQENRICTSSPYWGILRRPSADLRNGPDLQQIAPRSTTVQDLPVLLYQIQLGKIYPDSLVFATGWPRTNSFQCFHEQKREVQEYLGNRELERRTEDVDSGRYLRRSQLPMAGFLFSDLRLLGGRPTYARDLGERLVERHQFKSLAVNSTNHLRLDSRQLHRSSRERLSQRQKH